MLIKDVFKFKNKTLISFAGSVLLLLFLSSAIPTVRVSFLNIVKAPLILLTLLKREAGALIFFHRNFFASERLFKENSLLRQKLNTLNEINLENTRLKKLLSLKQESTYKLIAARVIGRSPDNWSCVVIIDKGSFNGIKRGMVAVNHLGLLGRVTETGESTSKILLISDPNLSISGIVQRSRQEGLVSGTLGSNLIMRYIPEDADIKIRDAVVTSGLNAAYPKGLLIGRVVDINNEFSGLSRYAIIKPAVNLSDIEEVLVVIQ